MPKAQKNIIEKVTITFDPSKFLKRFNGISNRFASNYAEATAKGIKKNIDKGLQSLKGSTIDIRNIKGTGGTKPLYETGRLYNSIKANKSKRTVGMLKYGLYHHAGYTPSHIPAFINTQKKTFAMVKNKNNIKVDDRPFIHPTDKDLKKPLKVFRNDIKKAIKRKW